MIKSFGFNDNQEAGKSQLHPPGKYFSQPYLDLDSN